MNAGDWCLKRASYSDVSEVYSLLKEAFFFHEPATSKLFRKYGPPPPERCIAIHALSQARSFKAVSSDRRNVVGVALNLNWETLASWEPAKGEPNDTLRKFFDYIEENSNGNEEDWLTLQLLTVHPNWRRKGIAEALVQATEEEAVREGYRGTRIVCTSTYSAHLVEKRGWTQIYKLPYSEYPDSIFKPESPHLAVRVYVHRNPDYMGTVAPLVI